MHVMVHGFFGKYAIEHVAEDDVIEMKIDNELLAGVFEMVSSLNRRYCVSATSGNTNNSFSNDCVVKVEDLPDFMRAIMFMVNCKNVKNLNGLAKLSALIHTAQRYNAPIYYL
ncbi:hypothetical protein LP316_02710 [Thalassotalea sp. LPB0316]|uniref:hypothetical protein n=1 Tax=Thalassotalea sp. LPB0316 TaxID=2769490 RepID=UPI00186821FD|nr:hypothetical protein [Thalassotalea sp. LPB0316]QOL26231.1 hypothetical protein LP316_02710 [Thalassotalea sp. LPB0316]